MSKKFDETGAIIPGYSRLTFNEWNEILETACEKICMYPSEYKDPDDMQREKCESCPLAEKLMEFEDE